VRIEKNSGQEQIPDSRVSAAWEIYTPASPN